MLDINEFEEIVRVVVLSRVEGIRRGTWLVKHEVSSIKVTLKINV